MIDEPDPLAEMLTWTEEDWQSLREALGVDLPVARIREILRFAETCGGLENALEALEAAALEADPNDKRAA